MERGNSTSRVAECSVSACTQELREIYLYALTGEGSGKKLFTKVIQRRLQGEVEEVVSDSQCGFRKGRECTDIIFCARTLAENLCVCVCVCVYMFVCVCARV